MDPNGMTILGLDQLEVQNTPVDQIETERVNLISIDIDGSGSMEPFVPTMTGSLIDFQTALTDSKEADEILVSRTDFKNRKDTGGIVSSGYKKIGQLATMYSASGMTPLYDTIVQSSEDLIKYMEFLHGQGMNVKSVFAVFSDGDDTSSFARLIDAKNAVAKLNAKEIVTAFICFGQDASLVEATATNLGFKNILKVGETTDKDALHSELRKAFNCLSKSVIDASKSTLAKTDDFFVM
jgi:hypothetical protein